MTRSLLLASMLAACTSAHPSVGESPAPDAGSSTVVDAQVVQPSDSDAAVPDGGPTAGPDANVDRSLEQDYDDLATVIGDVLNVPVNVASVDGVNMAHGIPPAGFANTATGVYSGSHDSIAYTYTYHCEDVNGADTYTCGPGTDHIHWEVATAGTATLPTFDMTEAKLVSHWHIRSFDVDKPRVEDLGRLYIAGRVAADQSRWSLQLEGTWTHVRYDAQPATPYDGTIAFTITAHRSRSTSPTTDRDISATATVQFARTASTITIDGTHMYALDMTAGTVTRM